MKEAKTTIQPQPPSGGLMLARLSVSSLIETMGAFSGGGAFFTGESMVWGASGSVGASVEPAILGLGA